MTWSAVITDKNGNRGKNNWNVCPECQHVTGCYIPNVSSGLANVVTSIDRGKDDFLRCGEMQMRCAAFEPKEEAAAA
jgi:hypothetical protein